jgi:membrane-bound serine protease (ClpP class)
MRKPLTGKIGMVGERGIALSNLNPAGKVLVHGTYWDAVAEEFIAEHEPVEVVRVDNLQLFVRSVTKPQ